MFSFTLGLALLLVAAAVVFLVRGFPKLAVRAVAGLLGAAGLVLVIISTAIYVNDNEGGVVIVKFGSDLPPGRIVATNGEKGPQAYVLPPGWHFGYWPWLYDLAAVDNIEIPAGKVGTVIAYDGAALPRGEVYAHEWDSPQEMLDGQVFLSGKGFKGPQLTVLPPGQYRYNPRLFGITLMDAVSVKVGEVVVVKASAGPLYEGEDAELVNGVPMVPNGFRGIWKTALTPNQYYMHPDAYELIHVRTTNRVYSYTNAANESVSKSDRPGDNHSIDVRTRDGFEFPIDIRAAVKISAEDAPYVTARIGPPDDDKNQDGFDNLEDTIILPTVRAIFRNGSESHSALEYVNTRSTIEQHASELVARELEEYRVQTDGIYIADIGLSSTSEGKELLKTQTDKEVAKQQEETWLQKKIAAEARAKSVRAEAEATQEENLVEAEVKVKTATSEAEAEVARATGKAEAARMQIEALGGHRNYLILRASELIAERWSGDMPAVAVLGEGVGIDTAVLAKMAEAQVAEAPKPQPEVSE